MSQAATPGGIGRRAVAASGWRFGTLATQMILQIAVLAVLSRLLPPRDFGVLGIAMIFVNLGTVVSDLGAGAALIQRREITDQHIRSTLALSLGLGLSLALVLGAGASWWAALFRSPRVEPVLQLLSVSFLFNAGALVPDSLLWRRMHMKALGLAEISSYVTGFGVVGISLAFLGFGIWSLAWAVVVQSGVRTVSLFWLARQSPVPSLGKRELQDVLGFGLGVSLTKLFNFAATKGDYVIVGRWLGGETLGLYERAYRLMEMPATYFAGVVARLLFPALSEVQDDRSRLQRGFQAALVAVILVYAPGAVALGIAAPYLIRALFGAQWVGAISPLQILAVALMFRGGHKICDAAIRAKGAVYRSAGRVLIYAIAVIIGAGVGQRWGITGVATGVTVAVVLRYAMIADLAVRLLGLGWGRFFRCHSAGVVLAVELGGILVLTERLSARAGLGDWPCLLILAATTGVTMVAGLLAIPPSWLGRDLCLLAARFARRVPGTGAWVERLVGQ